MPQWTTQQNNAINARNRNILVSAAAGSGKTAVLVERVIKIITDKTNPVDIDRLLVVTFTNAAAAEMKFRISKSLNKLIKENPNDSYYKRQLSKLPNAKITTIDAFCSNLVKEHFYELSINQDFSLLDEGELELLTENVISDIIDEFFNNEEKDIISLIDAFSTPSSDKAVAQIIKNVLRFIYAQPFPYHWFDKAIELYNPNVDFENSIWFEYIKKELEAELNYALQLVEENRSLVDFGDEKLNEKFLDVFNDDYTEITRIKNALEKSWDSFIKEREPSFTRMASSAKADKCITERLKVHRDVYKKIIIDDISSFKISSCDDYKEDVKMLYAQLLSLKKLILAVDERLMNEKRELNSYSFADIEHFAIKLLFSLNENNEIVRTRLAQELSNNYYEILVDEYQDTNEAQDLLFSHLSNGKNLFTVGDIKQSIYRFRLAMPHIFNKKKKLYKDYDASDCELNSKIILDKNFRSRNDICSFVNFVFSNVMSEDLGELNYDKNEYLNYGADYNATNVSSAQIKILTGIKGEDFDRAEATYIAKTICEKINSQELIKDGDTYRPIRYGDFAILMRSLKSHVDTYSQVLADFGIPVICDKSTNLFENNEIRILLSLIRAIDNPTQDIPLLTTMLSPIYSFTPDDLARLRIENRYSSLYGAVVNSNDEKAKSFISDLNDLRNISVTMSVSSFIRYLVEEKGFIAFVNAMGNGEQRYQNILKLISFANKFDNGVNVGLTAFIRYIDKISSLDKGIDSASLNGTGENAVTLMSVHHSKGLEFPVCLYAGASKQYNKRDLYDSILLNTAYGIGMKCHNEEQLYQYNSIPYAVIKNKNLIEGMSENLRVLYVAMTRAKEQFITFITVDSLESKLKKLSSIINKGKISPYGLRKINNDADIILLCSLLHNDAEALRDYITYDVEKQTTDFSLDIDITDSISILESETNISFVDYDEEIIKLIKEKLSFSYDKKELSQLSSKLSASSLDDVDRGFEYITSSKPSFLNKSGLTPAERGTAMHAFMQYCNYDNAKNNLDDEINRIVTSGLLSIEQGDSLDKSKLSSFFLNNEINALFSNADKIYKEFKISSFVDARQVYGVNSDERVLVQGIADCVLEINNELYLIDYKTDRVDNENELLDRYKKQISFYKYAVEKTLKKPVVSSILYSFSLGKCCYYK